MPVGRPIRGLRMTLSCPAPLRFLLRACPAFVPILRRAHLTGFAKPMAARILIVEDDADIRDLIAEALTMVNSLVGAVEVLRKPFTLDALYEAVSRLIWHHRTAVDSSPEVEAAAVVPIQEVAQRIAEAIATGEFDRARALMEDAIRRRSNGLFGVTTRERERRHVPLRGRIARPSYREGHARTPSLEKPELPFGHRCVEELGPVIRHGVHAGRDLSGNEPRRWRRDE
jgi:hypothetical protein